MLFILITGYIASLPRIHATILFKPHADITEDRFITSPHKQYKTLTFIPS